MIAATNLGSERGNTTLFSCLTFKVGAGKLLSVTGPNGSGKSTLLKIIAGLLPPTTGVVVRGESVIYIGHQIGLHPALTPLENLRSLLAITYSIACAFDQMIDALWAFGLKGYEHSACFTLSRGQCQRVILAGLVLSQRLCWIVDEPLTALDEEGTHYLIDQFLDHINRGGCLIVASHQKFTLQSVDQLTIALGA